MPERLRLSVQAYNRAILEAPTDPWLVARITNGEVLGSGATEAGALHDAAAKHPGLKIEDFALLRNPKPPAKQK